MGSIAHVGIATVSAKTDSIHVHQVGHSMMIVSNGRVQQLISYTDNRALQVTVLYDKLLRPVMHDTVHQIHVWLQHDKVMPQDVRPMTHSVILMR